MPTFPEWWNWVISFTGHAELRMEQRGVTEVEVHYPAASAGLSACGGDRLRGVLVTERSLQVTYRKGRAFAAYLHLLRATGEKSTRTAASADGLLIVDYAASGRSLGVEITAPGAVSLERFNQLLAQLASRSRGARL
jgi:hypothetical protein